MHTVPPFRADHVGSLLRTPEVLQARDDYAQGRISDEEKRRIEDDAIRAVVRMQEDIGLQGVTDGEYRRASWHMDFIYQIGGITKAQDNLKVQFHNEKGDIEFTPAAMRVTGKLKLDTCIFADDFTFLRSVAKGTPKLTIPSPSMVHYRGRPRGDRSRRSIPTSRSSGAIWSRSTPTRSRRSERSAARISSSTTPASRTSTIRRSASTSKGSAATATHQHVTYIRHINAALAKKPAAMRVCTHMCRGNFKSSWVATGSYEHVADALFNQLNVDGFFLEYDDARSGGFEPLRFVPPGKFVVLGLVTTKKGVPRAEGQPQAPDRRGVEVRAARSAVPQPAVRLLVDRRGQRADHRGGDREVVADCGDGAGGVGVTAMPSVDGEDPWVSVHASERAGRPVTGR